MVRFVAFYPLFMTLKGLIVPQHKAKHSKKRAYRKIGHYIRVIKLLGFWVIRSVIHSELGLL